jgi:hypothetical protein
MQRARMVIALALGLAVLAPPATAQETTPATGLPVTPDPAECVVAPRRIEDFAALVGTSVPAPQEAFARPRGEPADPETAAAITATVRELVACFNAGDWLRAAALYTNAGFGEDFAGTTREELLVLEASPSPIEEMGRVALIAVRDIERLPDERAGAVVVVGAEGTPDIYAFLYFAPDGERWLIDYFVDEYDPGRDAT